MGKSIFLAISSHGYGHLTQALAIANALIKTDPHWRFVVQCALPTDVIAERLDTDRFVHLPEPLDVGLVQPDPLYVDTDATLKAYRHFHAGYADTVAHLQHTFNHYQVCLILADIPYAAVEAGSRAGIPVVAIASLTWDAIVDHYLGHHKAEVSEWLERQRKAYALADLALLPEPAMDTHHFAQAKAIAPLMLDAKPIGNLRDRLGIPDEDKRPLVLVSLGGMVADRLPFAALAFDMRYHWLVNQPYDGCEAHVHGHNHWPACRYRDLVASVDALVGKPGYATAIEAAHYQLPFVFTCRGDFPDEPVIVSWLHYHARAMEISREAWQEGHFGEALVKLFDQPEKRAVPCQGAAEAVRILRSRFKSCLN